jgi:hypothetical protein
MCGNMEAFWAVDAVNEQQCPMSGVFRSILGRSRGQERLGFFIIIVGIIVDLAFAGDANRVLTIAVQHPNLNID